MTGENTTRPRFARLWKIGAFGLLGLIALGMCIRAAVLHSRAEKERVWAEIQKRLDAIRAAGEPVTADDLAKLHPDPPPDRDAALLLAPAVAALRRPDFSIGATYWELLPRSQRITSQMRTNIEAILNDNQTALNAIPWDKITNAWVGSGFALGFSNMEANPVYPDVDLARILCLKAIFEAEDGNGTNTTDNLRQALALFRTIRPDRLTHLYYRRGGEAFLCAALELVLNRVELSTDDLAALEHLLSDDYPEGLRETLLSLRCQNIWDMNDIRADPISAVYPPNFRGNVSGTGVLSQINGTFMNLFGRIYSDADFSEMLEARSAQIAALKLPLKKCFAEFDRIWQVAVEGRHPSFASGGTGAARDISSRLRLDAETHAKLLVTRVALEVERWRLAHGGRTPDSLADLVPQFAPSIPLDPFDNNPLRYKKLARGFLVYSIGADFTDDGGKEKPTDAADTDHYDITFSVER
jgi:hypothetical protein